LIAAAAASGAALAGAAGGSRATPGDVIRVGGPSAPADSKLAIVGSKANLAERWFVVLDAAGHTALRGRLRKAAGWPGPWRHAAVADLSTVTRPGAYRVRAGPLTSSRWTVREQPSARPIATLLQFFAANSDGAEASPLHGPAHLHDAVVASGPHAGEHIDLTGGWMDAGDMLKFATALALAAERTVDPVHSTLLAHAVAWYAAGKTSSAPNPKLPVDGYPDRTWRDDMAAGAAALYRATGEQAYLDDATTYLASADNQGTLGWDSVGVFAAADLCGALGAPATSDPAAHAVACHVLGSNAQDAVLRASSNAFATPGDFAWGQTAANGGAGAVAALAGSAGLLPAGRAVAAGARDYLVGRNPWGSSFVVGLGPRAARHPHHWGSVFGSALPVGAVVGGPAPLARIRDQRSGIGGVPALGGFNTAAATYEDRREDYVTSEPAIDYSACSILLLAALSH
jgi:hypothetical protein